MAPPETYLLIIDGSNFYYKLKEVGCHKTDFNYAAFAQFLATSNKKIKRAVYHVGKIRTDGSEQSKTLHAKQQKLFAHLKKQHFDYMLGYLLKSDGVYHEKGVDVNMAVEILLAAYERLCDRIILVSSDTDLIPAIEKVKRKDSSLNMWGSLTSQALQW